MRKIELTPDQVSDYIISSAQHLFKNELWKQHFDDTKCPEYVEIIVVDPEHVCAPEGEA